VKYKAISNKFYIKNRGELVKKVKENSIVLLFSSYQMPRNGDQYFNYRQNSDFFYLTGIEQEKSILLLSTSEKTKELQEILFILKPEKELEIWEGHKLSNAEASQLSGIENIKYTDDFESILHMVLYDTNNIYFNIPEVQKFKPEVNACDIDMLHKIKKKYPGHRIHRLAPLLRQMRLIKSVEEIDMIKTACKITKDAFIRVLNRTKAGIFEYEIEAEIIYEFIKKGAQGHAYPPIVAGGPNACVLHYTENDKQCKAGDLLLLDFGAEYGNYAADLSRTIPINGQFSERQRQLYESTLRVFRFARKLMVPGTSINKLHKEVCKLWEEEHIKLGLYTRKEAQENSGENGLWYNYYMHGTGHFLGLDVHDVGTRDIVLQPGMVLTCEPGLYIAGENTGIRIENNILITENGNHDLMEDIPVEIDEIELLMES
jgi:Xaa-Pro aminopeptidase